jgi:phosphoglycerate kinase
MAKSKLRSITEVKDLTGKYVLLRSSLNVPVKEGVVHNQFRLMRGLATINYLSRAGARVVVCGHISSSKETEKEDSLRPVFEILKHHLSITMSNEVVTARSESLRDELKDGEVLLLENLRQDPREKKNDADFARALADLGDIYVNDAFAASHREHASIVGVTKFLPSYVGLNFLHEVEELDKAMKPKSPSLFMLGGAKFDTKMPLVEKYLNIYDQVFVGGALANDFFKAKGLEVGKSLVSDIDHESLVSFSRSKKLLLPLDVTVVSGTTVRTCSPEEVTAEEAILDVGPKTTKMLASIIEGAKTVLWNGPFGNYEKGFDKETTSTAVNIAQSDAYSVIGGGDTIAAIESLHCQERYGFLSTAGGAMLTYLEYGTLPAIEAIEESWTHTIPSKKSNE